MPDDAGRARQRQAARRTDVEIEFGSRCSAAVESERERRSPDRGSGFVAEEVPGVESREIQPGSSDASSSLSFIRICDVRSMSHVREFVRAGADADSVERGCEIASSEAVPAGAVRPRCPHREGLPEFGMQWISRCHPQMIASSRSSPLRFSTVGGLSCFSRSAKCKSRAPKVAHCAPRTPRECRPGERRPPPTRFGGGLLRHGSRDGSKLTVMRGGRDYPIRSASLSAHSQF